MNPEDLIDHPEGGRFLEVHRSSRQVLREDGTRRTALSHIYYALEKGELSRFHRVASDEVWNLYRGGPLHLHCWAGGEAPPEMIILSPASGTFCHTIPAGTWQAAESPAGSVLVGCSVAPGFDFADFALLSPSSAEGRRLLAVAPDLRRLLG